MFVLVNEPHQKSNKLHLKSSCQMVNDYEMLLLLSLIKNIGINLFYQTPFFRIIFLSINYFLCWLWIFKNVALFTLSLKVIMIWSYLYYLKWYILHSIFLSKVVFHNSTIIIIIYYVKPVPNDLWICQLIIF